MNKEGRRKGYCDIQLLYPSNGYHGLIIELKRLRGGATSAEQLDFIAWHNECGYQALICRGAEEAQRAIQLYLNRT